MSIQCWYIEIDEKDFVKGSEIINNITKESIDVKLNNYLLDPTQKIGATKAQ